MTKQQYVTKEGLEKAERDMEGCLRRRKEIADRISIAKDMGDLSENAEYHQAQEDRSFNEGRIQELDALLKNAVVKERDLTSGFVEIGSRLRVSSTRGEQMFTIVGPNEVDAAKGKISHESPIGDAFLGKRVHDIARVETPRGAMEFTVLEIE